MVKKPKKKKQTHKQTIKGKSWAFLPHLATCQMKAIGATIVYRSHICKECIVWAPSLDHSLQEKSVYLVVEYRCH